MSRASLFTCAAQLLLCASALFTDLPAQPLTPFGAQKAERLLRDTYGCLGCHALRNEGGQLAPSLHDVRSRRDAAYIAMMVSDPQRTKPGASMPHTRMPARDRALIVRYLGGDTSRMLRNVVPATGTPVTDGRELYAQWCAGCHGVRGNGDGPNASRLPVKPARHNSAPAMSARSDDALFDTIEAGGAIMNRSHRMPAFGGTLTSPQIRALVGYIRTLCRCQGPAWSRDGGGA